MIDEIREKIKYAKTKEEVFAILDEQKIFYVPNPLSDINVITYGWKCHFLYNGVIFTIFTYDSKFHCDFEEAVSSEYFDVKIKRAKRYIESIKTICANKLLGLTIEEVEVDDRVSESVTDSPLFLTIPILQRKIIGWKEAAIEGTQYLSYMEFWKGIWEAEKWIN